jgi:hypothetical protein
MFFTLSGRTRAIRRLIFFRKSAFTAAVVTIDNRPNPVSARLPVSKPFSPQRRHYIKGRQRVPVNPTNSERPGHRQHIDGVGIQA